MSDPSNFDSFETLGRIAVCALIVLAIAFVILAGWSAL